MSGAAGTAAGGGGDLSGGNDEERNAQLDSLRKMFTAPDAASPADEPPEADASKAEEEALRLGLLLDLPLVRYSWCLLPHHQIAMSVWQPQYTLLFNRLLATPAPHYYLHVLLPGGAESLGEPGYELETGTQASLVGTLTRIVYARRNKDETLTLVVQGLCRGVVLRPTQYLPYSKGDVQVLPDAEALRAAARAAVAHARGAAPGEPAPSPVRKRRMVAAAAAAEASSWFAYEAVQLSIDEGGTMAPLNQLNASALAECAEGVRTEVGLALAKTPTGPLATGAASGGDASADEEAWIRADLGGVDPLYNGSVAHVWLDAAVETAEEEEDGEGTVEGEELAALELQVWLELDDLLTAIAKAQPRPPAAPPPAPAPVPPQMLGLLPPAPKAGWPAGFGFAATASKLRATYKADQRVRASANRAGRKLKNATAAEAERRERESVRPLAYVPLAGAYPARRRAERLSWAIWAVIGDQKVGVNAFGGSPYQPILEAESTADRLRAARLKMREYKENLPK